MSGAKKGAKKFDRLKNPIARHYTINHNDAGPASDEECRKDPLQANVYADWLRENGFEKAAEVLAKAFPITRPN